MSYCGVTIRRRQYLAALLLLAFVYQMFACPCGCAKHDYWRMAFRGVFSADASQLPIGEREPTASEDDDDCVHKPRDRSQVEVEDLQLRQWDRQWRELITPADAADNSTAVLASASQAHAGRGNSSPPPLSALALRAGLQVYRL